VEGIDVDISREEEAGISRSFGDEEEAMVFDMSDVKASWAPTSC
jgi:hypothetical protein